ncbi:MAG: tetratricopeptide repeat protein [Sedimentisphaerales bacterium]|jgi:tetratricopeptide (TPR) repeat protein
MRFSQKYVFVVICAALVTATFVAYEPIRHNGFVTYDDDLYVTENTHVNGGITRQSVAWAFTINYDTGNWHPVTWLSHMVDCEIYGLNPLGHHITNLLIHVANSLLLFLLLFKMTGARWRSAFVAATFALHPIHVESVAWAAERKDVLSGLFWMLTILAYVYYAKRPNIRRYVLVLSAFVMSLMSKPIVVTLPFVLLLLDYWPLGRLMRRRNNNATVTREQQSASVIYQKASIQGLLVEKVPMFMSSAVSSVITLVAQKRGGAFVPLENWPLNTRVINALGCYYNYIVKILYPKGLAVLYPLPENTESGAAALAVIGAAVLLVLWGRRKRWLVVGLLWYLGTLVPVIGLVQVGWQIMADRYTYLPSIGVFIIIAWGAEEIFSNIRYSKMILTTGAAAAVVAMVLLTRIQVGYWRDSPTLFDRAIDVTRNNFVMYGDYGQFLIKQGQYEQANRYLKEALRIHPTYLPVRGNICVVLLAQNKLDEAISCFTEELRENNAWPEMHRMYNNLGSAYEQKGDIVSAETNYRKAIILKPDFELGRRNLGRVFLKQGKFDEAIECFDTLLLQKRDSEQAHYYLGMTFLAQKKYDEAIAHLNEVIRINPHQTEAYAYLGEAYGQLGKYELSIQYWTKALELKPDNAEIRKRMELYQAGMRDRQK